jgi:hypothetical protein
MTIDYLKKKRQKRMIARNTKKKKQKKNPRKNPRRKKVPQLMMTKTQKKQNLT